MEGSKVTSLPKVAVILPSVGYLEPSTSTTKLPVEILNHFQQLIKIPRPKSL